MKTEQPRPNEKLGASSRLRAFVVKPASNPPGLVAVLLSVFTCGFILCGGRGSLRVFCALWWTTVERATKATKKCLLPARFFAMLFPHDGSGATYCRKGRAGLARSERAPGGHMDGKWGQFRAFLGACRESGTLSFCRPAGRAARQDHCSRPEDAPRVAWLPPGLPPWPALWISRLGSL